MLELASDVEVERLDIIGEVDHLGFELPQILPDVEKSGASVDRGVANDDLEETWSVEDLASSGVGAGVLVGVMPDHPLGFLSERSIEELVPLVSTLKTEF